MNDLTDPEVDSEEMEPSDSQQSQSTQPASQDQDLDVDNDHLWGYLEPISPSLNRLEFLREKPSYNIGRSSKSDYYLGGIRISGQHCTITWDGRDNSASVLISDHSSNGTFVNRQQVGRGCVATLRDGYLVAFGSSTGRFSRAPEIYCYTYRHIAYPPPSTLETYYDYVCDIGRGSYGIVKKFVCRSSGVCYAVKMITNTRSAYPLSDKGVVPRRNHFNREIDILQRLEHPNICRLREAFVYDNTDDMELVLELVEGGDFFQYLYTHAPLSEVDSQHFTFQICDALTYIHSHNVAHRDLKPENILLTKDNPPILKVADFGLAKFVDSQTMLRTMCGSPHYIAPEVVNGGGYDTIVDSWSLGVIVFAMLSGKSPFSEDENQSPLDRVRNRTINWNPLYYQSYSKDMVSEEGVHFIRCLLKSDPLRRMSAADSLQHTWLKNHIPVYGRNTPGVSDESMTALASATNGNSLKAQDLLTFASPVTAGSSLLIF